MKSLTMFGFPQVYIDLNGCVTCADPDIEISNRNATILLKNKHTEQCVRKWKWRLVAETHWREPVESFKDTPFEKEIARVKEIRTAIETDQARIFRSNTMGELAVDRFGNVCVLNGYQDYLPVADRVGRLFVGRHGRVTTKAKRHYVDFLLASLYVPFPKEYEQNGILPERCIINHLDGDFFNNGISNLEWMSEKDAVDNLKMKYDNKWFRSCRLLGYDGYFIAADGTTISTHFGIQILRMTSSIHFDQRNLPKQIILRSHAVALLWKNQPEKDWAASVYANTIRRYIQFDKWIADDYIRKIPTDTDNSYYVSRDGEIYSGKFRVKLRLAPSNHGYLSTNIRTKQMTQHALRAHRLVAELFIPVPEKYISQGLTMDDLEVNHIDADKNNNRISNLEWVSHDENIAHASEHGLHLRPQFVERCEAFTQLLKARLPTYQISRRTGLPQYVIRMARLGFNAAYNTWLRRHGYDVNEVLDLEAGQRARQQYLDRFKERNLAIKMYYDHSKDIVATAKHFGLSKTRTWAILRDCKEYE